MAETFETKHKNLSGIWFFGLAGAGKTFASHFCSSFIENAFVIDGDEVRKLVSFDLDYSMSDRKVQLRRVYGLAQIAKNNDRFPIVSTVTMTEEIYKKCIEVNIDVVQIIRPLDQLNKVRKIYETDQNVVGKNIQLVELNTIKFHNNGDQAFEEALEKYVK
jgi:hypothetical protein